MNLISRAKDRISNNEDQNQKPNMYSDEELLEDLRETNDSVEGNLTIQKYNDNGSSSAQTHVRRFGSWNEAKEEAGLETSSRGSKPRLSKEELIEELESRKTYGDIAEEHEYYDKATISNKVRNLGLKLRNKLSVPSDPENHSVIMTLKQEEVREAGRDPQEDDVYFEKIVGEDEITIKFYDERVKDEE